LGLVNFVVASGELEARGIALAEEIAANAPLSLSGNKRVIAELVRSGGRLSDQVEAELIELRRACFVSEDFHEGVRAFGEKRTAGVARTVGVWVGGLDA